jgi:RimJ/RimL family protein N-acetyltransferase
VPFDLQPQLVGELLEVRPLRPDDFDELYEAACDPLIWEQHPDDRHEPEVFREFFDAHLASGGALAVVDRRDGRIVGTSRYDRLVPGREVEIGWTFLVRSHWGGESNAELKRLMLEHAFGFVECVKFRVDSENLRSQRAVEKLGAVRVDSIEPDARGRATLVYELRLS